MHQCNHYTTEPAWNNIIFNSSFSYNTISFCFVLNLNTNLYVVFNPLWRREIVLRMCMRKIVNILPSQFCEFQYDILIFPLLNLVTGNFKAFYWGSKCPLVTATHVLFFLWCWYFWLMFSFVRTKIYCREHWWFFLSLRECEWLSCSFYISSQLCVLAKYRNFTSKKGSFDLITFLKNR